jgi:NADH:ubiquinone oxidoreductase subunit F (NADH-binding)/NADH:ubiquinone oxidoreductase subunit E
MIVQELLRLQEQHGFVPRRRMTELADRLAVPLYRVHEVASFFPHFKVFRSEEEEARERDKLPEFEMTVCRDMACQLRGSADYLRQLAEAAQPFGHKVKVCGVSCLGRCDRAPAVRITSHGEAAAGGNGHAGHHVRALMGRPLDQVVQIVEQVLSGQGPSGLPDDTDAALVLPQPPSQWRIDVYRDRPREERYASIRKYLDVLTPEGHAQAVAALTTLQATLAADPKEAANRLVKAAQDRCYLHPVTLALWTANLLGMGGAGGRAYKKWSEVIAAGGEKKYVVCNGDESEPGTFKDRELFLRTPHLVVEGVILAGLLVGAERGYIYIRHEYEEAIEAVRGEIAWARQLGLCGEGILGTRLKLDVEVFVSPGGYICGEQTALIQAIQDERAEPRNRPPELQTNGLWNMPTVLNNVETLAWVPGIVTQGAADGQWYADQGAAKNYKGARFFSVSGDVNRPGVYEVPIGITLGELIEKHCGGIRGGGALKAVALSGPSGGFLPPKLSAGMFKGAEAAKSLQKLAGDGATELDIRRLPLDLGVTRGLGIMLGAAIIVYADGADLVDQAVGCLEFYKAESCGKCVPCRIGTTKLVEIGQDLRGGELDAADVEQLRDQDAGAVGALARTMGETAICGLGQIAAKPLQTLLAHFPDDVARYAT